VQAAHHIDKDILLSQRQTHPFGEHGRQQKQAVKVDAIAGAPGALGDARAHQRLHFNQDRARAFHGDGHRGTCGLLDALLEEHLGRICHLDHPPVGHLKDAHLVSGAKAVLDAAQQAIAVKPLALQVQHRVDDVLQHSRASDAAGLGHVADEEGRNAQLLGLALQGSGTGADLAHTAR